MSKYFKRPSLPERAYDSLFWFWVCVITVILSLPFLFVLKIITLGSLQITCLLDDYTRYLAKDPGGFSGVR